MCGRYGIYDTKDVFEFIKVDVSKDLDLKPNYNAAPTQVLPVARTNEAGIREINTMHWGFMGWKPKKGDRPFIPINTRDDKILTSRMWKSPFLNNRCIVPANGFYEWNGKKGNKTPHFIYPKNGGLMGFAGIYSTLAPEGSTSDMSFSIITTSPNRLMEPIHDRMPVILLQEEFDHWLDPKNTDPEFLTDFLKPYPDEGLKEHIVGQAVGNVRNNDPGLIEKADLFS